MAYTTTTLVINWLGTSYDTGTDLTSANVTAFIDKADDIINASCQPRYYRFNAENGTKTDGTDTYITPGLVVQTSTHLAAGYALLQLRAKGLNTPLANSAEFHIDQANFYLGLLKNPSFKLDPETWRNYTLTWGTQAESWDLPNNEAFISPTALDSADPPNILEDSVRIGSGSTSTLLNARLGREFDVRWDQGYQRYVFTANDGKLYETSIETKITFEWDYRRDRGKESHLSGVLLCG